MTLKESYIIIDQVRMHAYHGVLPQERRVGDSYLLTLRVGYDVSRAMETDNVDDTLSYAELLAVAQAQMKEPSLLIEHVAGRIARNVFERWPQATSLDITLTKQNPPMGAACNGASVELHFINS